MRAKFTNPAEQPIKAPPGNANFGTDCHPPDAMARAPYEILLPWAKVPRING